MKWTVPLTDVTLDDAEVAAATEVLRSGWLSQGGRVQDFEAAFAVALGMRHAVAVTNGTAALHMAYQACGLKPGDEFILPALTFIATMNAGLYLGAKPVLADCTSENDLTLSVRDVERKITPRTRLIVPMAYGGFCPDMPGLRDLAEAHDIAIVEDACHAPLAEIEGKKIGSWGQAGCFSLFSNKNFTSGEGGLAVTDDDEIAARLRLLRSHGMTTLTWDRHRSHAADYDVLEPGYNYRFDELRAAVALEQLRKLPAMTEKRRNAAAKLRKAIETLAIPALQIPFSSPAGEPVHHLFVILLPPEADRASFRKRMTADGIQTSVHYPPLHRFSVAQKYFDNVDDLGLTVLDALAPRLVTLPMGPHLDDTAIAAIADAVGLALQDFR
ncbi:MAG: DegT/DnrJ/EryC1/StrS family aminotransferase [Candidatus Sumerlaeota bacterium]